MHFKNIHGVNCSLITHHSLELLLASGFVVVVFLMNFLRGSTKMTAVKKQKERTLELGVDVLDFKMVIAKQTRQQDMGLYEATVQTIF